MNILLIPLIQFVRCWITKWHRERKAHRAWFVELGLPMLEKKKWRALTLYISGAAVGAITCVVWSLVSSTPSSMQEAVQHGRRVIGGILGATAILPLIILLLHNSIHLLRRKNGTVYYFRAMKTDKDAFTIVEDNGWWRWNPRNLIAVTQTGDDRLTLPVRIHEIPHPDIIRWNLALAIVHTSEEVRVRQTILTTTFGQWPPTTEAVRCYASSFSALSSLSGDQWYMLEELEALLVRPPSPPQPDPDAGLRGTAADPVPPVAYRISVVTANPCQTT